MEESWGERERENKIIKFKNLNYFDEYFRYSKLK